MVLCLGWIVSLCTFAVTMLAIQFCGYFSALFLSLHTILHSEFDRIHIQNLLLYKFRKLCQRLGASITLLDGPKFGALSERTTCLLY